MNDWTKDKIQDVVHGKGREGTDLQLRLAALSAWMTLGTAAGMSTSQGSVSTSSIGIDVAALLLG